MREVLAEAVTWYVRLHDSQVSEQQWQAWRQWLAADARHAEAWQRVERLQQRLGAAPAGAGTALEGARRQRRALLKALVVLLGVGVVGWRGYRASPWSADYATRVGERRRVLLADGSRLELDTDTRVDVRFDAGARHIHLRQGEILVETGHDARRFSVQTAEGEVLALGTRFSVRQESALTRVSVEAHAVAVTPRLASGPPTRVEAGQMLTFGAEHSDSPMPAPADASAWTHGMLVAVDWPLARFLDELGRYRHGYLGCAPEIAGLRLSGAFTLDDTDAVLDNLARSLPVRIRRVTGLWVRVERRAG
ncbi:MAG: Protein FecR [Pseudomonas citronellolis]|nr:MAG: Protein FecR [Pseudomonas citronellolis]